MKTLNVLILVLSISVFANAEDPIGKKSKRFIWGGGFGFNYSNLKMDNPSEDLKYNSGIRLTAGAFANWKINDRFTLSPKLETAANRNKIEYTVDNVEWKQAYYVMPITLNFITHFQINPFSQSQKIAPYFLIGPNVKKPLDVGFGNNQSSNAVDVAIDVGIGFHKSFTQLNFMPEIRYSYGLRNVNDNPRYGAMYLHNIVLIFQFSG